ncbi:hypothetical protein GOP47_0022847, partial [Adiantum capillus-veneris]
MSAGRLKSLHEVKGSYAGKDCVGDVPLHKKAAVDFAGCIILQKDCSGIAD